MSRRADPARSAPTLPSLKWPVVAIPAAVGVLVVVLAWLAGPGLLGVAPDDQGVPTQAEVTKPAACSTDNPVETVKLTLGGKPREGTLSGCGHAAGEHLQVGVPADTPDTGVIALRAADTSAGIGDPRVPIGFALLAFSCFAGGMFVYLVLRRTPGRAAHV